MPESHRLLVLPALLALSLSACVRTRPVGGTAPLPEPDRYIRLELAHPLRSLADTVPPVWRLEGRRVAAAEDSVVLVVTRARDSKGRQVAAYRQLRASVPRSMVVRLEAEYLAWDRTLGLLGGIAAGMLLVVAASWALLWTGT